MPAFFALFVPQKHGCCWEDSDPGSNASTTLAKQGLLIMNGGTALGYWFLQLRNSIDGSDER
jgi:hypothetical protein